MNVEEEIGGIQQQIQFVLFQRQNLEMQSEEYLITKKRLKDVKGELYKIQGPLLLSVTKTEAEKELDEKIENNQIKVDTLKKQEIRFKTKIDDLIKEVKKSKT